MLRNVGGATRSLTADLQADNGGVPGVVLATSQPIDPADLPVNAYSWMTFVFATPQPLTGGQTYWVTLDPNGLNSSKYFMLRLDENMNFLGGMGRYYNQSTGSWNLFPPSDQPDTFFRFVCVSDTSEQLLAIAGFGGQFFPKITAAPTGIATSPYRKDGLTCLAEVKKLMALGTENQRLVLAEVSPNRHLRFYEQPQPDQADVYMDRFSRFYYPRRRAAQSLAAAGGPLLPVFPVRTGSICPGIRTACQPVSSPEPNIGCRPESSGSGLWMVKTCRRK